MTTVSSRVMMRCASAGRSIRSAAPAVALQRGHGNAEGRLLQRRADSHLWPAASAPATPAVQGCAGAAVAVRIEYDAAAQRVGRR
jgi:hypothetical protein